MKKNTKMFFITSLPSLLLTAANSLLWTQEHSFAEPNFHAFKYLSIKICRVNKFVLSIRKKKKYECIFSGAPELHHKIAVLPAPQSFLINLGFQKKTIGKR